MKIKPSDAAGSHKTGSLPEWLSPDDIEQVIGFPPNIDDDASKVTTSWGFTIDDSPCGIWDYKGSRWSVYDPDKKLPELFSNILAGKAA